MEYPQRTQKIIIDIEFYDSLFQEFIYFEIYYSKISQFYNVIRTTTTIFFGITFLVLAILRIILSDIIQVFVTIISNSNFKNLNFFQMLKKEYLYFSTSREERA